MGSVLSCMDRWANPIFVGALRTATLRRRSSARTPLRSVANKAPKHLSSGRADSSGVSCQDEETRAMAALPTPTDGLIRDLRALIARHWGFTTLRPLQEQAMRAVLDGRDSLVVFPTGGGKSLCFQAPAALREDEVTVVVSPLIALMK